MVSAKKTQRTWRKAGNFTDRNFIRKYFYR